MLSYPIFIVAAKHENDTCFGSGLVMPVTDCIIYAGLDKIQFGPLPDQSQK